MVIFSLLLLYSFVQFIGFCVFNNFFIPLPFQKTKEPVYHLDYPYYTSFYRRVYKLEYKYTNIGNKYDIMYLIPFAFLFGVKKYIKTDEGYGKFYDEDILVLNDDFCLRDYYEEKHAEDNYDELAEKRLANRIHNKIDTLNNKIC